VNVAADPPPQVTNVVAVSGGGSLGATASVATFIGQLTPALEISATSSGAFLPGQNGSYTVTVGNQIGAAATNGLVVVTENPPANSGLTVVSMGGTGWNCVSNTCSRSESLAGGGGYPAITVVAAVSSSAGSQVTNRVTVSGGESADATETVVTPVSPLSCAIDGGASATVTDVQILINEALGLGAVLDDLNRDGVVDIADVQIEINAALGSTCFI
jgi:uncharacterized repeat protein (TIGR01451 family)